MRLVLLGDVTMDFFAQDFRRDGHEVYLAPGFGAWRQELLDPESGLQAFRPDAILLVRTAKDSADAVSGERVGCRVFEPPLDVLARETPGFWDERMRQLAAMPFSLAGLKAIEDEFRWALLAREAKVLALDADNTLWNGIITEDGVAEVLPLVELQRGVLALRDAGAVLALLSKNDLSAVREALARDDMPLAEDDFAFLGVNWSPKAGNLLAAAKTLNLSPDAFVFLDDNAYERAEMSARVPEVAVPPFGSQANAAQTLRRLNTYFFAHLGRTDEDRRRAAMYREETARRAVAAQTASLSDYLESLELRARFARATDADVPRLAQMAGKTNQFNATTRRLAEADFRALLADDAYRVWTVRASDRFGDMGLVCYAIYDCATARLTDFVMSCRAMGRTLEGFALNHIRAALAEEGRTLVGIDYVPTAKNGPFRTFLEKLDLSCEQVTYYKVGR